MAETSTIEWTDAALSLVPKGGFLTMSTWLKGRAPRASAHVFDDGNRLLGGTNEAATLPLALCIAAIKARRAAC